MKTNILILSAGTRNKVVQYFKKNMTDGAGVCIGNVIATDMSENAPAIYEADRHYIVPRMTDVTYLDVIIDSILPSGRVVTTYDLSPSP